MVVFIQKIVHNHQRNRQMAVFPKRKDSLSVKYPTESVNGSLFQQKTVHLLFQAKITNGSLLREDGLFHLKIPQAVSKWQSLSAEDSLLTFSQQGLQMAVSFSRRQFDSLASQQMAVSFSRRQFAHFPSPEVSKWQSLSAEDSLLTFIQQGLQMAVSPSRRQFVPLAIGKWQSFPKKRQFVYLTLKEIDKWQFLQTVCLFPGCLVPHRVDEWQFSH